MQQWINGGAPYGITAGRENQPLTLGAWYISGGHINRETSSSPFKVPLIRSILQIISNTAGCNEHYEKRGLDGRTKGQNSSYQGYLQCV